MVNVLRQVLYGLGVFIKKKVCKLQRQTLSQKKKNRLGKKHSANVS